MKRTKREGLAGFTLIELLVVISIIGVLSSVVLVSMNDARNSAHYATVKSDFKAFTDTVVWAQGEADSDLRGITGSGCSGCACRTIGDLRNLPDTNQCYANWENALDSIILASGGLGDSLTTMYRDPWGSPYVLDENEGEVPSNPCRIDNIRSVGADGLFGTSDDYLVLLPFSTSECY